MPKANSSGGDLVGKYKPQSISDVRGQSTAVGALLSFVASVEEQPASAAFLFTGPTGVGKTAAAWGLAFDLGCSRDDPDLGGVHEIPSGTQDGRAVVDLLRSLALRPLFGSGWKVAIVNEADGMTKQAETMWLDGLEHLPPKTVIVFTTNEPGRLGDRFRSRCEEVEFSGSSEEFKQGMVDLIREVWRKETGKRLRRIPGGLGKFELASEDFSIRLALRQIAPYVRGKEALPARFGVPMIRATANGCSVDGSTAAKKAWTTRRRNGKGVLHA